MKIFRAINPKNRPYWIALGFLLLLVIGLLDYFTGVEISFSLFYVFPIAMIAWAGNWRIGTASALAGGILWLLAEAFAGARYSHPIILYWNAAVRLGTFLIIPFSVKLGKDLEREANNARTDFITGAFNSRYFHELAQREVDRSARYRHPFTLAYLDIDNFKSVNDIFGHSTGDRLLHIIVDCLKSILRSTDIIARVGGDEFAILLPETGVDEAKIVMTKAHKMLQEQMEQHGWSVTISAGVVTFVQAPQTVDAALDAADRVMYEIKKAGKNGIIYKIQ